MELTSDLAHHIIARLGQGGLPPEHGVEHINVGNESYLRVLEHEYFGHLLRSGATFKLVQGYFGAGKTHFLHCVRALAWRHGFVTAVVELSPAECPYDDAVKVYRGVVKRVATAPREAMRTPEYGLGDLLRTHVDDALDRAIDEAKAAGSTDPESQARREVARWLERTVGRAPCESHSFREAIVGFGLAHLEGDRARARTFEAWLLGESVPVAQMRELGVYEQLDRANGFAMLRCLTQMMVGLGFAGTALLFDEVDRNLSVSAKRSQAIGDNLRQVIDLCGRHQLPQTLLMYAVPPEFMRNVVPDYPALYQRLKSPVPLSVRSPQAVLIDLERLDLEPAELLSAIAGKITHAFQVARGVELGATVQRQNAEHLARAAAEAYFEVNHRRLFVKTWVDFLHTQLVDGEIVLTPESASQLIEAGHTDIATAPADDDFSDF